MPDATKGHAALTEMLGVDWPEDLWARLAGEGTHSDRRAEILGVIMRDGDRRGEIMPALITAAVRSFLDRIPVEDVVFPRWGDMLARLASASDEELERFADEPRRLAL